MPLPTIPQIVCDTLKRTGITTRMSNTLADIETGLTIRSANSGRNMANDRPGGEWPDYP